MKRNKYILPIVGLALMLNSCYDDKMVWGTPDGHDPVVSADIPLTLAEKIANYDYSKKYVTDYKKVYLEILIISR